MHSAQPRIVGDSIRVIDGRVNLFSGILGNADSHPVAQSRGSEPVVPREQGWILAGEHRRIRLKVPPHLSEVFQAGFERPIYAWMRFEPRALVHGRRLVAAGLLPAFEPTGRRESAWTSGSRSRAPPDTL